MVGWAIPPYRRSKLANLKLVQLQLKQPTSSISQTPPLISYLLTPIYLPRQRLLLARKAANPRISMLALLGSGTPVTVTV